ncbi:MAG: AAA family ATPase [Gammaproteobacteria bacterium]|nr:AAA family ATPase [Gammaproteobacteria bacterium]
MERKRLHGLPALARTGADSKQGIYTSESTTLTYQRLLQLTESIINAAYPVLVDATFLKHSQRDAFRRLAIQLQTPFIIIDFAASENTLRQRIAERQQQANDASEADVSILEQQLRTCEPLQVDELAVSLRYDTEQPLQASSRKESWTSILKKLDLSDS